MLHRSTTTKKEARNNNIASASNTRAEAAEEEDDPIQMQVDTGEVENNNNEKDIEKRGGSVSELGSVSVVTFIFDTILDTMFKDNEQEKCQEGDIKGASKVVQMKKNQGIKINEDRLNSLILGHVEARDMPKIPLTTVHYNALLRVHLENGHKFRPEQVLEDMRKHGAAPDKETYQCLISRHCQEGDIEGASKFLQLMKNQGIKINENMFNSLILGHREAGDRGDETVRVSPPVLRPSST